MEILAIGQVSFVFLYFWTLALFVGKIEETEGFPLPPPDNNGEHRWLHSETYVLLKTSVEKLKKSYGGADILGAYVRAYEYNRAYAFFIYHVNEKEVSIISYPLYPNTRLLLCQELMLPWSLPAKKNCWRRRRTWKSSMRRMPRTKSWLWKLLRN